MNTQVALNQTAINTIVAKASDGSVQQLGSLAVTIDDYLTAYLLKYPPAGTNGFVIVPKNPALVGTKTVNVTAHATDLSGNALPLATLSYDIVGATPPPLATSLVIGTPTVGVFVGISPDPGSPTVTLI